MEHGFDGIVMLSHFPKIIYNIHISAISGVKCVGQLSVTKESFDRLGRQLQQYPSFSLRAILVGLIYDTTLLRMETTPNLLIFSTEAAFI